MKKFLLLIVGLCSFFLSFSQTTEEAVFTHYTINPILINPALAGFSEAHQIQMNIRTSWTSFPGAPKTYAISYNGPVGNTLGLGLSVLSENVAALTNYRIQLNYGFRIPINDQIKLGAGLSTEFTSRRLSDSVPIEDMTDEVVLANMDGIRYFDAAMGFYGTYNKNTFVGLSLPNMVLTRLNSIATDTLSNSYFKSFIFQAGHNLELEDYNFALEPSIVLRKMENIPLQVDINLLAKFLEEKLITGLSYHAGLEGGVAGILLGTKVISGFKLYYSYDVSFQQFQQYNGGSHEVTVAFDFSNEGGGDRRRTFR